MNDETKTEIKNTNKNFKIVGLVILVFTTQLFSMFVYERYIQRSIIQQMIETQHKLRLLVLEYRQKNILPKMFVNDEILRLWGRVDISDPRDMYREMINLLEDQIKRLNNTDDTNRKKELKEALENAKMNKEMLIEFFRKVLKVLRG